MFIPLALFYYIYLFFVLAFLLFSLFNLYHIIRFGWPTIFSTVFVIFYLVVAIAILAISWYYISQVDWKQVIDIQPQFSYK